MLRRIASIVLPLVSLAASATAQDPPPINIVGTVPVGEGTHFFVEFEVPEGIAEIEVQHESLTPGNTLDWGLDDPNGFRGWGGGNSEPAIVGERAASRSYIPGPMPAGTWEVVVGTPELDTTPAEYEITILRRTEATLEPQERQPYEDPGVLSQEARWYAGDFHVHSVESGDARGTIEESLAYARSVGLDFLMFSEHNTNSGLTYFATVQPDYPDVLIIPGVEWTTYSGHGNAIGATEWVDHKTGTRGVTAQGAIDEFHEQDALFYPTHPDEDAPGFCIGCLWEYEVDPATLDGVETWSGEVWNGLQFYEQACAEGAHAVSIGGSDDHDAGQGNYTTGSPIGEPTTLVYAENLSVQAILDAVRAGRTVVKRNGPDDPMLETELSGQRVGDTVFADVAALSATVTGGEGRTLLVIKNGSTIDAVPIDSDPFMHQLEVTAPPEGEDRYRHQVAQGNQLPTAPPIFTIGSYVWLRAAEDIPDGGVPDASVPDGGSPDGGAEPSSSSGCSCRVVGTEERDTGLLLFIAAMFGYRRRSRRRST